MKKLLLITFITFLSSSLFASEEWFCTSQSSQMIGDTFYSCGIGESLREQGARDDSNLNAINQFRTFCEISSTCKQRLVAIEAGRMSCEIGAPITDSIMFEGQRHYKCYKLVLFHMES